MDIKAQDVKKLRDETGAGFLDCKKALVEANGDFSVAQKILKEMGLTQAGKRSDRDAFEKRIFTYIAKNKASILELSCETDFVSRNDTFIKSGEDLIKKMTDENLQIDDKTVLEMVASIGAISKENVSIKKFDNVNIEENELVFCYVHGEAGTSAALVKLLLEDKNKKNNPKILELSKDLALHLVAFKPTYTSKDDVSEEYIKELQVVFEKQLEESGKSKGKNKEIIQKMLDGKLKKHIQEISFLSQAFVKDDKNTVEQIILSTSKELESKIEVVKYFIY